MSYRDVRGWDTSKPDEGANELPLYAQAMETPPWEAAKRINRGDYGGVVWQSTQNPRSFLDSVMSGVASSSKGGLGSRRTASEPSRSQKPVTVLQPRSRSAQTSPATLGTGRMHDVFSPASYNETSRKRPRKSGLGNYESPKPGETLSSEVDIDELASLVGTVSQSLRSRASLAPPKTKRRIMSQNSSRSQPSTSEAQSSASLAGTTTHLSEHIRPYSQNHALAVHGDNETRPARSHILQPVPVSTAMDMDPPIPIVPNSNTTTALRSLSRSAPHACPGDSQSAGHTVPQKIITESALKPPSSRKLLSPIIERFGTSKAVVGPGAKSRSLGMKGTLPSVAAAKPFKTPLPAASKRHIDSAAFKPPVRREPPPVNAGDPSSDLDTSFGIDMDCLEEHLKAYD